MMNWKENIMIKVIYAEGRHLVLYLGTKDVIDEDISELLDWYAGEYGIDAMYDMLLTHSRKKITEARRALSAQMSKEFISAYPNHDEGTKETE